MQTKNNSNNNNGKTATSKALSIELATEQTTFAAAMGIDATRERELCDMIERCYEGTDTYPKAIACLSQVVSNINELAYCLFHMGAFAGNEQAKQAGFNLSELEARLAELKKGVAAIAGDTKE